MNRIGKAVEGIETNWVAWRTETECFAVVCDGLFDILHLTRLIIASMNRISKDVEGIKTIWVVRRTE
jgi:hypothetical protein